MPRARPMEPRELFRMNFLLVVMLLIVLVVHGSYLDVLEGDPVSMIL
jgi:hypothetical protein